MRLALDEPKPEDEKKVMEGFTFVADKGVLNVFGNIIIDASAWGIELRSGSRGGKSGSGCSCS